MDGTCGVWKPPRGAARVRPACGAGVDAYCFGANRRRLKRKPLRIGIDNVSPGESTTRRGPGGMRMYLQEMVKGIARLAPGDTVVLLTPRGSEPLLAEPPQNVEIVEVGVVPASRPLRVLYQQTRFLGDLRKAHLDVLFATATVSPVLGKVPTVLAVQFLQFYRWPEAFGTLRTAYLRGAVPVSVRRAARVITFSESAKADLIGRTGVPPDRVAVIPHGLNSIFDNGKRERATLEPEVWDWDDGRPFILYVSALYPYKNHRRLMEAFALVKARTKLPHRLVLAGGEAGVRMVDLAKFRDELGLGADVVFTGRVGRNEDVRALYEAADALVFPSLDETFGFPPLEAMACGCPVVVSDKGACAEVVGEAGICVDVEDVDGIAAGIERVLCDAALRKRLIVAGRSRAAMYTWDRSARMTLDVLRTAAS